MVDIESSHLPVGSSESLSSSTNGRVRTRRAIKSTTVATQPWEALNKNLSLKTAMAILPSNYHFEIPKCLWKILSINAKTVALQFPEGLLLYACIISDIFKRFTGARCIMLSDVTYGACCVDDYTAEKVGADLLIHYGHSCLVPITNTTVKSLYVFVEIEFNCNHLLDTIKANFQKSSKLAILGTVQFIRAVREVRDRLAADGFEFIEVPQVKPLSPGETLGCTSPQLDKDLSAFIFIADGRFHMESAMIRNPTIPSYRYDPYNKVMSLEKYDIGLMKQIRLDCVTRARQCKVFGVILGTLGHQGNTGILKRLKEMLQKRNKAVITFLMAELNPVKLKLIKGIDAWIQIACPRLSIDWGLEYEKIILTPYEAMVALEQIDWREQYPMDYYSNEKNPWSNYA